MKHPDDDIDWRCSALVSSAAGFPIGVDNKDGGGGALKVDHTWPSADRDFYQRPLFARALIFLSAFELSKKT